MVTQCVNHIIDEAPAVSTPYGMVHILSYCAFIVLKVPLTLVKTPLSFIMMIERLAKKIIVGSNLLCIAGLWLD